jgi:hypothetical protein
LGSMGNPSLLALFTKALSVEVIFNIASIG